MNAFNVLYKSGAASRVVGNVSQTATARRHSPITIQVEPKLYFAGATRTNDALSLELAKQAISGGLMRSALSPAAQQQQQQLLSSSHSSRPVQIRILNKDPNPSPKLLPSQYQQQQLQQQQLHRQQQSQQYDDVKMSIHNDLSV